MSQTETAKAVAAEERWRRMTAFDRHPHTDYRWRPQAAANPQAWEVSDPLASGTRQYTIGMLTRGEVYAVQLYFDNSRSLGPGRPIVGDKGFSVRESYVWPSDRPAGGGERVATFPLTDPISPSTGASLHKAVHKYVVCEDTFPAERVTEWGHFIAHAFAQWNHATDGLVSFERLTSDNQGNPIACADYSSFVDEVTRNYHQYISQNPGNTDQENLESLSLLIDDYLERLQETGLGSTRTLDYSQNEVLLYPTTDDRFRRVVAFYEVVSRVSHRHCGIGSIGCAARTRVTDGTITTDIRLAEIPLQNYPLEFPGVDTNFDASDVKFNRCSDNTDPEADVYRILVHEAGHVLGIRGIWGRLGQDNHHPIIENALMSYRSVQKYNCSPQPMDIMAIYALYQTR